MDELIEKLRILQVAILNLHHRDGEYVDKRFADVCVAAADAIERLMAEVDRKDKTIERMRDLMKHYKAAYRTAYKLYQEARNEIP